MHGLQLAEAPIIRKWHLRGEELTNSSHTYLPTPGITQLKLFYLEGINDGLEFIQIFSETPDKGRHIISSSILMAVSATNPLANS